MAPSREGKKKAEEKTNLHSSMLSSSEQMRLEREKREHIERVEWRITVKWCPVVSATREILEKQLKGAI